MKSSRKKSLCISISIFLAILITPISLVRNGENRQIFSVNTAQAAPVCTGGQLGGIVFRDFNSNGAYDTEEVLVEGITISVYDTGNNLIASTTTDTAGEYVVSVPNGDEVRVEMTGLPSYLQPAQSGTIVDSSVRFITNSDTCDVDFGVINPADFCEADPDLALACYANGDGSTNTTPGFVTFPYTNSGLETTTPYSVTSEIRDIGTVWGTAWQPKTETLYTSTFLKRHSTMKDGPGHVYVYDYAGTAETLLGSFDLQGVTPDNGGAAIDLGTVCRDSSCGVTDPPTDATLPWHDQDAFGKVAKMSYGDIDIAEDSDQLWLVNLNQQALISVDISDPDPFVLGTTNQYDIGTLPGAPVCSNGDIRPWALKFRDGKGYLGAVCDAAGSADSNDLSGYILSFDPLNPTAGFTNEVVITAAQFITGGWQYWTDDWATLWPDPTQGNVLTNLPLIMDIEFEADNDMVISVGDRVGHMGGYENYGPDITNTTNIYSHFGHGDVTSFCLTGTGYALEPTTGCPGNYSSPGLNGWTEYYQDESADNVAHNSMGGFAMHYSQEELVSVVVDPFPIGGTIGDPVYWNTGGIHWYDVTTGAKTDYYRLYPSMATELFGKASGLGDVELLCSPAPIEIGNRVWIDTDNDGLQDAGEAPIAGVTVELLSGGTLVGTAVTDANGHYYFGGVNNTNIPTGSIDPLANYDVSIDTTQTALAPYALTTADANSNADDTIDSDGSMSGTDALASTTTQAAGHNRHSLDFGFYPASTYALSLTKTHNDADNTIAPGDTVTYTITIANTGNTTGTGIDLTDTLSSATSVDTVGNFTFTNCGASHTNTSSGLTVTVTDLEATVANDCVITYDVTAQSPGIEGDTITNTVDITAATEGGNDPAATSAPDITIDTTPDLSTSTKTVTDTNGGAVEPGDTLAYTVTIINSGNGTASGVDATDTVDLDTTLTTASVTVANCGSAYTDSSTATDLSITDLEITTTTNCVITFDVVIADPLDEGTTIGNTITLSAPAEGGVGASPSSTDQTIDGTPALVVLKVDSDADNLINPSGVATYTVTIQNTGNATGTGIDLADTITGPVSSVGNFTFTDCGTAYTNTSTGLAITVADLEVAPATTCTITYDATVDAGASAGATISNTADVSPANEGSNDPTPQVADTLTVNALPSYDLALTKQTTATSVNVGDTVTFNIEVTNQGNAATDNITITDYIPAGFTLNDSDWSAGTNGASGISASVTLSVANTGLPAGGLPGSGATVTVPIDLTVVAGATNASLINYAEISAFTDTSGGAQVDADSTPNASDTDDVGGTPGEPTQDNVITDDGTIDEDDHDPAFVTLVEEEVIDEIVEDVEEPFFDLALSKTSETSGIVSIGDDIDFIMTITNEGTIAADNITIIDYIPAGLVLNDPQWTSTPEGYATRALSIASGSIAAEGLLPGQSMSIPITLQIAPDAVSGGLVNISEIAGATDLAGGIQQDIDSTPDTVVDGDQANGEDDQDQLRIELAVDGQCSEESDIGNMIFEDVNCNGKYDKDIDEPLDDIKVKLKDESGETVDEDNTNSKGKYELHTSLTGRYHVVVDKDDIKKFAYSVDPGSSVNPNNKAFVDVDQCGDDTTKMDFGFIVKDCELAQTGYDTDALMCLK